MDIRYPEVTVQLSGEDGNVFSVIGRVQKALRRAGVGKEELAEFRKQAMSGDYDNALRTAMQWVNTE